MNEYRHNSTFRVKPAKQKLRNYTAPRTLAEAKARQAARDEKRAARGQQRPKGNGLGRGKKSKAWDAERRKLKVDSELNERTTCELRGVIPHECTYDNFLGYAHDAKRRKLSRADLERAILVCNNIHDLLEVMKPEEMKRIVNETIEARGQAAA